MSTTPLHDFLRDDAGTPLGPGMPGGRPLRLDGERHYDAWLRLLRADPCAYCGRPGGTVDHVEPRSRRPRGIGSAHGWLNVVGACARCNAAKRDGALLAFLRSRAAPPPARPGRPAVPAHRAGRWATGACGG